MQETIPYTPPWLQPAEGEERKAPLPRFDLRLGSIVERDAFDAELEGKWRAKQVPAFLMLEVAVRGLHALLPPDDAAQLEELLRAAHAPDAEALGQAELQQVKEAEEILAEHWTEYRLLVEQNARHDRIAPTLAFQRWCAGWDNVMDDAGASIAYERTALGEIPDATLRRLSPLAIRAAGYRALNLQYGAGEAKN